MQSQNLKVCEIDPDLKKRVKEFRFRKGTTPACIMMKVNMEKNLIVLDEEYEDIPLDDIADEIPASQPRFLVYSFEYVRDDGRKSYPLCFIYVTPDGCKPEMQMNYAGSKIALVNYLELTKTFEIRSTEDLTEDWLREKLSFFK